MREILVPLDGSPLAEQAIAEAAELAHALHAGVVLLRVVSPVDDVIQSGTMRIAVDEIWTAEREEALKYLNDVAQRSVWQGATVAVVVELGGPAETILDIASRRDVSRIVMATHGRTGMTRWVFGSVAEKVLRAADRTVVLVRSQS
jgi:nucleotide-binding universal stress UspA family protein